MKTLQPHVMTRHEISFFGSDGKLKVIKQWMHNNHSYSARRDTDGYIGIVDDSNYFGVGNSGYDYCFSIDDIDSLAKRLGVM